jgi:ligand-binding sensor domain-containing protein
MGSIPVRLWGGGRTVGRSDRRTARIPVAALVLALLLTGQATAGVTLISPSSETIASTAVLDMAEGRNGEIYFATDSGLSIFLDGWTTLRTSTAMANGSLLSSHVLAVETDYQGYVWVGYPNGLQVFRGPEIETIQDQQLLKNLDINVLLRRGDEMWVAAGSAGVHRWRGGTWYWIQPGGKEGLGAYDIRSMAEDRRSGALYLASLDNGLWVAEAGPDPLRFAHLMAPVVGDAVCIRVRADPLGGMYLFNRSTVLHHSWSHGFQPVLNASDLTGGDLSFFDLAVADSGAVWLATDTGIYGLSEGRVMVHLTAPDGIGSNAVKRIYADHRGRVWFATKEAVGFITGMPENGIPIPVRMVEPVATGTPTSIQSASLPHATPVLSVEVVPGPALSSPDPITGFFSGLARWLAGLFGQKG